MTVIKYMIDALTRIDASVTASLATTDLSVDTE